MISLGGAVRRDEPPFSPTLIYVAAGVTALSVVLPIALYAHANSIKDDYDVARAQAETSRTIGDGAAYGTAQNRGRALSSDYDGARSTAQVSLAVPIVFGAATAGLGRARWLFGSKAPRASALLHPDIERHLRQRRNTVLKAQGAEHVRVVVRPHGSTRLRGERTPVFERTDEEVELARESVRTTQSDRALPTVTSLGDILSRRTTAAIPDSRASARENGEESNVIVRHVNEKDSARTERAAIHRERFARHEVDGYGVRAEGIDHENVEALRRALAQQKPSITDLDVDRRVRLRRIEIGEVAPRDVDDSGTSLEECPVVSRTRVRRERADAEPNHPDAARREASLGMRSVKRDRARRRQVPSGDSARAARERPPRSSACLPCIAPPDTSI